MSSHAPARTKAVKIRPALRHFVAFLKSLAAYAAPYAPCIRRHSGQERCESRCRAHSPWSKDSTQSKNGVHMMRSKMEAKRSNARLAVQLLLISGVLCGIPMLVFSAGTNPDALLATMQRELQRASAALAKSDPAPYYLSYAVTDSDSAGVAAMNGSLLVSSHAQQRQADVEMRVGSPALDNTHGQGRASGMVSGVLALDGDPDA